MAVTEGLRLVALGEAHVGAGLALSAEAGWNQTAEDWRFLITHGRGWGFEDPSATLVASAVVLPQGPRHAWISMVLVTVAWRRRGLATALVQRCLEHCEKAGLTPWLDATPAGQAVYARLGFTTIENLTRWRAASPRGRLPGVGCRPLTESDLPRVAELDRRPGGGERLALLAMLARRAPSCASMCLDGSGFALGRDGRTATQVGPIVANESETALALLDAALGAIREPCLVDAVAAENVFRRGLEQRGFEPERPFARMVRGPAEKTKGPPQLFAVAGPELG